MNTINYCILRNDLFEKIEIAIINFIKDKNILLQEYENQFVFDKIISIIKNFPKEEYLKFFENYMSGKPETLTINLFKKRRNKRVINLKNTRNTVYYVEKLFLHDLKNITLIYGNSREYDQNFD